jgi:transketolase
MINEPVKHVRDYVDAGSDIITVHAEVCDAASFGEIHDVLKANQVGVGLAINPDTELPEWSLSFIPKLDQIIVMSVVPGKSGQKYIEGTHEKTQRLIKTLNQHSFDGYIEADGGVTLDNIGSCFADGARAFVGGSAIIGQSDVRQIIREFRSKIAYARRKMLIQKAYEMGSKELVAKWIELHAVGDKKNQLSTIAKELGYT